MKKTKSNPDPSVLRVLILEDSPADAELVECELRRTGINFTSRLVDGKKEFSKALADFQPQVILADFKLPLFDGLAALEITRLRAPDTPFIFVSGSIGEEKAIELLAQGASDYIFKDNLQRLGPAVKRVVEAAHLKLEKKKNEEELRLLAEGADHFVHINDLDEIYNYLTEVINKISGADYLLLSLYDEKLQAVRPKIITGFEPFQETIHRRFHIDLMEMVFYLKDMRQDDFSDFVSRRLIPVRDGLYGLANRKIPRSTCRLIEKLLAVGSMHTMGFSWENQLFGGLTVFFKKANELKNASQIEALANLAAVSIKRLLVEQALRESEKKYRTLVTQSPDGIFVIDLQGNFLSVNQAMCAGLKYSEEEFLSLKIWDIVPEQYMDLHKKRLAAILKGETKNEAAEYMVRGKDGETHYIAILSTPFYKDNTLIGFQGIARDISESKKMEIRLRESEEYYRTLVESAPEAIALGENDGRILRINSEFCRLFGYKEKEVLGKNIDDLISSAEKKSEAVSITQTVGKGEKFSLETVRRGKNGKPIDVSLIGSPIIIDGQQVATYGIYRDISERKRAESQREAALEELRISAEKWQSTFNSITDIVSVISPDHMFLEINKAGCDAMGLKREDIIGKKCYELVHHLHNPLTGCPCSLTIQSKKMEVNEVFENGRYYQLTAWPILDANGELLAFSHTVKDISERKEAEEAFLREKAFLDQLVESAPEAIVLAENNGQILRVNSEFEKMFGYSAKEAIGRLIDDLVVPPKYRREATDVTQTVAHGEKFSLETVRWRKDGALLHVSLVGSPIIIGGEQVAAYGIYRDISDRKQAEEQIRASLKEKEVLLQEIHHRVKNNLQIISGLLTLQADQSAGKSLAEIFQASQDRIHSIALIHEKLYQSHNLAEIAFDKYLHALTENLFRSHGIAAGRITARYEMEPILFTIEKAIPLGLIVNELVTNALKYAFPAGRQGEICITLHECRDMPPFSVADKSHPPKSVDDLSCPSGDKSRRAPTYELIVADNGVGLQNDQIPEQQKSLGMNLVSMLAKQIQAELKVTTGPGTEFRLLFPGLPANEAFKDKKHGG